MYCRNCGAKLDDDAVFCTRCGKQIEEVSVASDTGAQEIKAEPETKKTNPGKKKKRKRVLVAAVLLAVVIAIAAMAFPMVQRAVDPYSIAFAEAESGVDLEHSGEPETPLPSLTQYGREVSSLRGSSFSLKDKGRGRKYIYKGSSEIGAVQLKDNTMTILVKQEDKSSEKIFNQLVAAAIMACNSDVSESTASSEAKKIVEYGFNGSYLYMMQSYHILSVNDDDGMGADYFACVMES